MITTRLLGVCIIATLGILPIRAEYLDWVDWEMIQHWAGDPDGEKKCALVVDFQDGLSNQAYVWGYRWNGTATGEDLVRAVASQSSVLTAMIQYTGTMGSTLNAFGISNNREELDYLRYDFENASVASEISFGFFNPNITMGQEVSPGVDAEEMCYAAISAAKTSGIIEHPLNAFIYGYAAYDYDYWQLDDQIANTYKHRWKAGWYDGYWSYWHGPNDYDYLGYSGLGMSSTVLVDEGVQAWKYTPLNGGDAFGVTGGEMAFELNYDMEDWGERMHTPRANDPIINHDEIEFWVGKGEKSAAVVLQFNDGKGPDNIIYGYRWSGGWDDNLSTVITNIAKADPRLHIDNSDGELRVEYDSDDNGIISDIDHDNSNGQWTFFVQRTVDPSFNAVGAGRWLNPNAVLILSRQEDDATKVEFPYQLMRPSEESSRIISIPGHIEYSLSDSPLKIPMFVNVPPDAKLSGAFTWSRPDMLSRINTHQFMGTISSYRDFTPGEVEVAVRGSYIPAGSTTAESVISNTCKITFKAPEIPLSAIQFENEEIKVNTRENRDNHIVFSPVDATYTGISYRSSNPQIVSVNPVTGELTTFDHEGEAIITACYNLDPELSCRCKVVVGNNLSTVDDLTIVEQVSYSNNNLKIEGLAGHKIALVNMVGLEEFSIVPESDTESIRLSLPAGIYVVIKDNCHLTKIAIQ